MSTSPSLHFVVKPGPTLISNQIKAPSLVLDKSTFSPALHISTEGSSSSSDMSHTIPALVFVCLGCLISIVTIPLSQGSEWARIPVEQLMANLSSINPPWREQIGEVENASDHAQSTDELVVEQEVQTLTPFELLTGVSCPAYFLGEQPSATSSAFEEHIWNKLPPEIQAQATERLEVCGPFELAKKDLIVSQGCVENECGTNDVRFFLTADDVAAVEIYANGQCTYSSEPSFRYKKLLCVPR